MRSVHGPVSRQRIQQHTALSAVLSNGPPPGDQRFPAFAPPFDLRSDHPVAKR